jgi:deoxyribodipyrimidine photolyase-related protein
MSKLCLILGDQLSHGISSLKDLNKKTDTILMCEVMEEATYAPHHQQKIAFIFSAMRHFAQELKEYGWNVIYTKIDDPENAGSFTNEIKRHIATLEPKEIIVTEASEWRVQNFIKSWANLFNIKVNILPDDRFLASHNEFSKWAENKKQLRMEYFYREMRRKYNLLMNDDGSPVGGEWNYDKENRNSPPDHHIYPVRPTHTQSSITQDVLKLTKEKFSHHFGTLDSFHYAVTAKEANQDLDFFIDKCLENFGSYQDGMIANEPFLYHSRISAYINVGLLLPLEVCQRAELAYKQKKAPLNAVEGFIRQIIGWREYIRGIYWYHMPTYSDLNALQAHEDLPSFYWGADTNMFCIGETVRHTRDYAYSHHIQRLMITGNFALLAGLDVKQVQEWYLSVYADAFEWVEMPNTLGMALFGDGGIVASKPYAASGKYINKMSNYCKKCKYNPNLLTEDNACPFNALYWNFINKHESLLSKNQRMSFMVSTWNKFSDEKKENIKNKTNNIFSKMRSGNL